MAAFFNSENLIIIGVRPILPATHVKGIRGRKNYPYHRLHQLDDLFRFMTILCCCTIQANKASTQELKEALFLQVVCSSFIKVLDIKLLEMTKTLQSIILI